MDENRKLVWRSVNNTIRRINEPVPGSKRAGRRSAWAAAMLAKLRRSIGTLESEAAIWEVTLVDTEGNDHAEKAVYTALTLYALHQQGKDICVSAEGIRFGQAVRRIILKDSGSEQGVRKRFYALATADGFEELSVHARALVRLMKQKDVYFDYPKFAEDLYGYQFDQARDQIRMQWGRDFEANQKQTEEKENE